MKIAAILAVSILATATPAHAKPHCETIAGLAASIMNGRQNGMTLTESINISNESENEAVRNLSVALTMDAYEKPRYSTPEFRQREVVEFQNKVHLACLRAPD